ncbi:fibrinogen-like protein 1-like protein isoform X2 [Bombina bombina]|nr:fibrinogen-like protein 1-like protein isoform X2 [Bombina bombina]
MLPYLAHCLCFLVILHKVASKDKWIQLSRDELYRQIANRHMLEEAQLDQLLNVPRGGVILELMAKDCRAAFLNGRRTSGLYVIKPKNSPPMVVYCDLDVDGGGWTVLQKNTKSSVNMWSSTWTLYKNGFGNLKDDHWLGNELIHLLTRQNAFTVRFQIVDDKHNKHFADYHGFRVDGEDNGYALRLGNYSGNAGDALTVMNETGTHDNMKFSTIDRDNDRWSKNCAENNNAGWWFDSCYSAVLNANNIYWRGLCEDSRPCVSAKIMIQPSRKNCNAFNFPGLNNNYPVHISSQ